MAITGYAVKDGFNQAENQLVQLAPQPATPEKVRYAELEYYGDSHAEFNGGRTSELVWTACTDAERTAVRALLGLADTVASNDLTINLLQNDRTWQRSNATAVYLQSDRRAAYGSDDLRVALLGIEASS